MNNNERLISAWVKNIEHDLDDWSGRAVELLDISASLANEKLGTDLPLTVALILEYADFESLWCHYDRSNEKRSNLNSYLELLPGFSPYGPSDRLAGAEMQHDYVFDRLKKNFPGRDETLGKLEIIRSYVKEEIEYPDGYPKFNAQLMVCALDFAQRQIENGADFTVDMILDGVEFERLSAIFSAEQSKPVSLASNYFYHLPGVGIEGYSGESKRLHAYACFALRDYLNDVMPKVFVEDQLESDAAD